MKALQVSAAVATASKEGAVAGSKEAEATAVARLRARPESVDGMAFVAAAVGARARAGAGGEAGAEAASAKWWIRKLEEENAKLQVQLAQAVTAAEAAERAGLSQASRMAEMRRLLTEQDEAVESGRLEELSKLATWRVQQLGISRGWRAWIASSKRRRWQRRVLTTSVGWHQRQCFVRWLRWRKATQRAIERKAQAQMRAKRIRRLEEENATLREHMRLLETRREAQLAEAEAAEEAAERAGSSQEAREHLLVMRGRILEEENATLREQLEESGKAIVAAQSKTVKVKRLAFEAAREQRVTELLRLATRRIHRLWVSRGWRAWARQCEICRLQRRLIANAHKRKTRVQLLRGQQRMLEEEKETLQAQLEESGKAVEAAKVAGSSKAARVKRLAFEAAREQRVTELSNLAVQRIQRLWVSRGWCTWTGQVEQRRRQQRLLAKSVGRLKPWRPRATACFVWWLRSWEAAQRDAAVAEVEARLQAVKARAKEVSAALGLD